MGYPGFDFEFASSIFREHAKLTAGTNIDISALDYEILKAERSVQWPFRKKGHSQGTARLFTDRKFYTPSQKAHISTVSDAFTSETPDADFPFILITGRIRDQWHTRSKTGKVNKLNQHISQAFVQIHPADAEKLQLAEDDIVLVRSRRGEVQLKARLSSDIKPGVIFLPMHWGKILNNDLNRANNLTNDLIDPVSKEPDFKYCAVSVGRYKKPR